MTFTRCHNCRVKLPVRDGRRQTVCASCEDKLLQVDIEERRRAEAERRRDPVRVLQKRVHAQLSELARGRARSAEVLLGYTYQQLRDHLERLFTPGMTWDAFSRGEIHIDHVVPLARLRIDSIDHPLFRHAWSLQNLQPLWADENIRKADKLPEVLPKWYTEYFGRAA